MYLLRLAKLSSFRRDETFLIFFHSHTKPTLQRAGRDRTHRKKKSKKIHSCPNSQSDMSSAAEKQRLATARNFWAEANEKQQQTNGTATTTTKKTSTTPSKNAKPTSTSTKPTAKPSATTSPKPAGSTSPAKPQNKGNASPHTRSASSTSVSAGSSRFVSNRLL